MERCKEATIIINGVALNDIQSMSIRLAIENFRWNLQDSGGEISDIYDTCLEEVEQIIVKD